MDCFCFEIWRLFFIADINAGIPTMAAKLRFPVQKKFLQAKTPVTHHEHLANYRTRAERAEKSGESMRPSTNVLL